MSLSKLSTLAVDLHDRIHEQVLDPLVTWAGAHPRQAVCAAVATLVLARYLQQKLTAPRLPPGPPAYPIVGSVLSMKNEKMYKDIDEFKKEYGDVHTIWFGSTPCVMLASYSAIKEAFLTRGNEFASRPPPASLMVYLEDEFGSKPFGEKFAREKKFVVSNLRTLGGFKAGADGHMVEEFRELVKELRESNQQPVDIKDNALLVTTNIMSAICFNERLQHSDPKLHRLRDLTLNFYAVLNEFSLAEMLIPSFLGSLFTRDKYKRFVVALEGLEEYMKESVEEHLKTYDPNNLRDFVDIYINKTERENAQIGKTLYHSIALILPDSIDSTAIFMRWIVLYLGHNPDVQRKIQKEVDEHVGPSQMVDIAQRPKLKYTDAVLYECMRVSNCSVGTGFHAPIGHGSTFRGYDIPFNATLFASLHHVHHDPELFPEPYKFDPNRFLDDSGDLANTNYVMPFGLGRRMCVGEHLVKTELFLFLGNLMHNFTIKFPKDQPNPTLEPAGGMIQYPADFKAIFVPRD